MSLRSISRITSKRTAVLSIACLAMTAVVSGCATMGGGASNPLVGTWDLVVESQLGTSEQTLVVASDLTGNITSADLGDTEISNAATDIYLVLDTEHLEKFVSARRRGRQYDHRSRTSVTGPSLTSWTSIIAPKTPVATGISCPSSAPINSL